MKNLLKNKPAIKTFFFRCGVMLFAILVSPVLGYSQATPPTPTGGSGGGSLPDSPSNPLGVPFDYKLNLLFLATAVVFAVVKFWHIKKNTTQKHQHN